MLYQQFLQFIQQLPNLKEVIFDAAPLPELMELNFPHHIKNRIRQRFIDKKKLPNILNMVGTFVQVQPQVSDEIV